MHHIMSLQMLVKLLSLCSGCQDIVVDLTTSRITLSGKCYFYTVFT